MGGNNSEAGQTIALSDGLGAAGDTRRWEDVGIFPSRRRPPTTTISLPCQVTVLKPLCVGAYLPGGVKTITRLLFFFPVFFCSLPITLRMGDLKTARFSALKNLGTKQ